MFSGGRRRKDPEGYLVQEHPRDDTHFRWPSPSLPPTLKKNPMKRGAAATKSKVATTANSSAQESRVAAARAGDARQLFVCSFRKITRRRV